MKIYKVKVKHRLAGGTIKEYTENRKYEIKGYGNKRDATRKLKSHLTPEQIAEIKEKLAMGISKKRLMLDYNCSYWCLMKSLKTT